MCSNDQDDENTESSRNSEISNFMPRIIADDKILKSINSLNFKQRDVFSVAYNCGTKEYISSKHW